MECGDLATPWMAGACAGRAGKPAQSKAVASHRTPVSESFLLEEPLQDFRALCFQHSRRDLRAMIQTRIIGDLEMRAHRPRLGIGTAVKQPSDTRLNNRAGAHRAGLDGDVKIAFAQAV